MGFVSFMALDGSEVLIALEGIYRVRPALTVAEAGSETRVDFPGGFQLTLESAEDLLSRLGKLGQVFAAFTTWDGRKVHVQPGAVSAIRPAQPAMHGPAAKSVLVVAGQDQAVLEGMQDVLNALGL